MPQEAIENSKLDEADGQPTGAPIGLPIASGSLALFVLALLLIYRLPRLASYAGLDSTWYWVPTARGVRVAIAIVMAVSLIATWLVRRGIRQQRNRAIGVWMITTVGLALCALGLSTWEAYSYITSGLTPAHFRSQVYDSADLEYLHAVRARLKQLDADSSTGFAAVIDDAAQVPDSSVSLVDRIQRDMVTWTEYQVALWESELDRRLADLMLFAYEIQPRADGYTAAESQYRAELVALAQEQKFLPVLCDYCQARLAEMGVAAGTPNTEKSGKTSKSAAQLQRDLTRLARHATDEQRRMVDWATMPAATVRDVTEQMQIAEQRLKQIDNRLAFTEEFLDPLFSGAKPVGLNVRYPWLNLPIQLPDIRKTTRALLLVRWTLLVWVFAGLLVLVWTLIRRGMADSPRVRAAVTFWQVLAIISLFALIVLG